MIISNDILMSFDISLNYISEEGDILKLFVKYMLVILITVCLVGCSIYKKNKAKNIIVITDNVVMYVNGYEVPYDPSYVQISDVKVTDSNVVTLTAKNNTELNDIDIVIYGSLIEDDGKTRPNDVIFSKSNIRENEVYEDQAPVYDAEDVAKIDVRSISICG